MKKQRWHSIVYNLERPDLIPLKEMTGIPAAQLVHLDRMRAVLFSPIQLNALDQNQFAAVMFKLPFEKLIQLDAMHFSWLNAEILKWFEPEQVQQITDGQLAKLYPDQLRTIAVRLSLKQILGLPKSHVRFLPLDVFGKLDASEIQSLPDLFLNNLTAEQLRFIERFMTPERIIRMNSAVFSLLDAETLKKLEPEQIQRLSVSQLVHATSRQFQIMEPCLSFRQIMGLSPEKLREIREERIRLFTANQLAFIKKSNKMKSFSNKQISVINEISERGSASVPLIAGINENE
ncbi:MAG: hypothetical protein JW774_03595 [Candidatus Aureabacteria bacterium]|nr:hypothetical protein [Candidatus Auribacterota bacterium]